MSIQSIDVMLDLETLSTRPNGLILTIGAIKFDRINQYNISLKDMDTFYRRIDIKSCEDIGLVTDQETIDWWFKQSETAKQEAFGNENRVNVRDALIDFKNWILIDNRNPIIWSHGANFDPVLLVEAYKACKLITPWKFYNVRDTRTLYDISGVTNKDLGVTSHHALEDCYRQINGVKLSIKKLKLKLIKL